MVVCFVCLFCLFCFVAIRPILAYFFLLIEALIELTKMLLKEKLFDNSRVFFFLRRGRNRIPHGDIPRWNLLASGLLFWFLFVIKWIYVFDSLANRLLIDLPLFF